MILSRDNSNPSQINSDNNVKPNQIFLFLSSIIVKIILKLMHLSRIHGRYCNLPSAVHHLPTAVLELYIITNLRLSKEYESLRPPVENFMDSIFPTARRQCLLKRKKTPAQKKRRCVTIPARTQFYFSRSKIISRTLKNTEPES